MIKTNKTVNDKTPERMMSLKIFKSTRMPIARADNPGAFSAALPGVEVTVNKMRVLLTGVLLTADSLHERENLIFSVCIFCYHFIKKLSAIICPIENFSNFAIGAGYGSVFFDFIFRISMVFGPVA